MTNDAHAVAKKGFLKFLICVWPQNLFRRKAYQLLWLQFHFCLM